ncbi:MAG: YIP1 family protein [Candidatus Aenigmatarchaeota archaeon]
MNFAQKFKNIFFDHSHLFVVVKKESVWKAVIFYIIFAFILFLINSYSLSINMIPANLSVLKGAELTPSVILDFPAHFFVINVIVLFVFTGLITLISRGKNKTTLKNNIKVFSYAFVPFMITAWITAFNAVFGLFSIYVLSKGIAETNGIHLRKAFYMVVVAGAITGILTFLATIVVMGNFGIPFDIEKIFLARN